MAGLSKNLFYDGILYRYWAIWVQIFDCLRLSNAELQTDGDRLFYLPVKKTLSSAVRKLNIAAKWPDCQKFYFMTEYCIGFGLFGCNFLIA